MEESLFEILENVKNLCEMQKIIMKSVIIKKTKDFLKQNKISESESRIFLSAWLIYRFPVSINEYQHEINTHINILTEKASSVVIECKSENKISLDNLNNFKNALDNWKLEDKKYLQVEMQNSVNLINKFKFPDKEQKILNKIKTNINTIANNIDIKLN